MNSEHQPEGQSIRECLFKIGDKVKIVNYGHPIWEHKNEEHQTSFPIIEAQDNVYVKDMRADLVGKIGVVQIAKITQNKPTYAIDGIPGKHAWYNEDQIELITI